MSKKERYQCKSYVDDNSDVQDCECGKCGYEHNLRRWKEAYNDILKVCKKYDQFKTKYDSSFGDIYDMKQKAQNHLMLIDWYEKYGLRIAHEYKPASQDYLRIDDHRYISYYNDAQREKDSGKGGRYISWSDDGRQPKNEWLFNIWFSTGAYIFGEDYPKEFFQKFFDELTSYEPDFTDRHNNSLYWRLENAKDVYDNYPAILEKYRKQNQEDRKQREIKLMEKKLAAMKGES